MSIAEPPGADADPWFHRVGTAWLKAILALGVILAVYALRRPERGIGEVYLLDQDLAVAITSLAAFALMAAPICRLGPTLTRRMDGLADRWGLAICLVAAGLVAAGALIGWMTVYQHYPLSMDEFWATFDARIFARGQLLAPVASPWRPFVPAMEPMWRLTVPGNVGWASTYLPMNAALQAGFAHLGSPALAGPCWAGLSILLTYGLARRFWPDRPDAALVAVLLLATSSQFIVTAMSPYAMPAHLALNLLWLWLFLQKRPAAQACAVVTAFVATGLHQFVFHPLFAAPFVLALWWRRQWRAAVFHTAAYAGICLFWVSWWPILFAIEHLPAGGAAAAASGAGAHALAMAFNPVGPGMMAENLFRFMLWQNPLATPLAMVGLGLAWRERNGPMAPVAGGLVLTLVFLLLITPFQGHGWGYRYLHGFLGSLCLLAAYAWTRLVPVGDPTRRGRAWGVMAIACLVGLGVWLPMRLYQVHGFIRPYARAAAAIAASRADVVIIETAGLWYGDDLVRNDPFLARGPKVMHRALLSDGQIQTLCGQYRVAWFDRADGAAFGIPTVANHAAAAAPPRRCGGFARPAAGS